MRTILLTSQRGGIVHSFSDKFVMKTDPKLHPLPAPWLGAGVEKVCLAWEGQGRPHKGHGFELALWKTSCFLQGRKSRDGGQGTVQAKGKGKQGAALGLSGLG